MACPASLGSSDEDNSLISSPERISTCTSSAPKRARDFERSESSDDGTFSSNSPVSPGTINTTVGVSAPKRARELSDSPKSTDSQSTISHSQSSTDSNECRSVVSGLPLSISNWEKEHLKDLNIKISFQPETSPLQLVNRKVKKTGLQNYRVDVYEGLKMAEDKEESKISSLVKYVHRSEFMGMLKKINYSTFDDLNINTLNVLDMYVDNKQPCSFVPKDLPEDLKFWFDRFAIHGRSFAYFLYKMVEMMVKGLPIHECHFQHLFDSFTKMFGLHSGTSNLFCHGGLCTSFVPCLHVDKIGIGKTMVSGAADIVYARRSVIRDGKELENPRIVAVCEVKKDRPIPQELNKSPPSSKTRGKIKEKDDREATCSSTTSIGTGDKKHLEMSDKLIGQHCAELLMKYPDSNRLECILGMVVQETHVTFTSLAMTDSQFQRIQCGRIKHGEKDRAAFVYTRPYDFLKEVDVKEIVEPLIRFGLEQE